MDRVEEVGAGERRAARSSLAAGDGEAFRQVAEPHRRELQLHCYRMLGSLQDAEDALQDTLLAAWRGLTAFEGRSSPDVVVPGGNQPVSEHPAPTAGGRS